MDWYQDQRIYAINIVIIATFELFFFRRKSE